MTSLFDTALVVVSRRVEKAQVPGKQALTEMRARLERLKDLSAEFSTVELSPYVQGLLGAPRQPAREPVKRAAGI